MLRKFNNLPKLTELENLIVSTPFIYLLYTYVLRTYYVLGIVSHSWDMVGSKTEVS